MTPSPKPTSESPGLLDCSWEAQQSSMRGLLESHFPGARRRCALQSVMSAEFQRHMMIMAGPVIGLLSPLSLSEEEKDQLVEMLKQPFGYRIEACDCQ